MIYYRLLVCSAAAAAVHMEKEESGAADVYNILQK